MVRHQLTRKDAKMLNQFVVRIKDAAQRLGLPIITVRKMIKNGTLDGRGFGPAGRVRYVTVESINKLMGEGK